jgi:hypothetical protein
MLALADDQLVIFASLFGGLSHVGANDFVFLFEFELLLVAKVRR